MSPCLPPSFEPKRAYALGLDNCSLRKTGNNKFYNLEHNHNYIQRKVLNIDYQLMVITHQHFEIIQFGIRARKIMYAKYLAADGILNLA